MRCEYRKRKSENAAGKYFVAFILLAAASQVLSDEIPTGNGQTTSDDADWNAFKQRFKKNYASPTEDRYRQSIRAQNLAVIRQHNAQYAAGNTHFSMAENSLVDLTTDEYKKLLGYRASGSSQTRRRRHSKRSVNVIPAMPNYYLTVNVSSLPTTVDWTTKGWVGPVENQGQCGSCWSYSATGSLEAQYFNQTGQFVELSEQNLIDCSWPEGNEGCNGGNVQDAFWYVMQNGIEPLSAYPDTSNVTGKSNNTCAYNSTLSVMKVNSWRNILRTSEPSLQQAVALVGPVSAAIDANSIQFQLYSSGVYSNPYCSSSLNSLDHAILVVGYGVYNNQPYWLIQNSWGTSWGMSGYMMMARDSNNMCGIATDATFPVAGWTTTSVGSAIVFQTSGASTSGLASSVSTIFLLCLFFAVSQLNQ